MTGYSVNNMEIMQGSFAIRAELRLKNSALISAREDLGLSQKEAAGLIGISANRLSNYENMKLYPTQEMQEMICGFYRSKGVFIIEEDVFPDELKAFRTHSKKYIREVVIPKQRFLTVCDQLSEYPESNPEEEYGLKQLRGTMERVLATLTPREEKVLRMRFGIGEEYDHTPEEVAAKLGVTPGRIWQIEAKALRRLRHPPISKKLKPYTEKTIFR
jgi:RNA polymerase sigma factor (sigma-70 family)